MDVLFVVVLCLMYLFFNALWIGEAVNHFKNERYFRFGMYSMFVFINCCTIVKLMFRI